jgi:hypothetical protein
MSGKPGMKSDLLTELPARYSEDFLAGMDGRIKLVRELKARLLQLQADLGGDAMLSYAKRSLCRRAIFIEGKLEDFEAQLAQGKDAELGTYIQMTNSLIGLFKTLGLERKARTLSLKDYIAEHSEDQQ